MMEARYKVLKDGLKIYADDYLFKPGYRFDRWIFQGAMLLIFCWLFFIAWSYGFNMDYYECQAPAVGETMCKNRFYEPASWKNEEYLPVGIYGTKMGALFYSAYYVPFILLAIGFILNQVIHNGKHNNNSKD